MGTRWKLVYKMLATGEIRSKEVWVFSANPWTSFGSGRKSIIPLKAEKI